MAEPGEQRTTKRRTAGGPRIALWTAPLEAERPDERFAAHADAIDTARARGADVVVFGELSLCASASALRAARGAIGRDDPRLLELARHTETTAALVGFVEESRDGKLFNSAAWLEGGRIAHVQRKLLVREDTGSRRGVRLRPGRGVTAIDTCAGRAAILIGTDATSPLLLSLAALDDALTIYVPAARSSEAAEDVARDRYLRSMAHALGVYVVVVERDGEAEAPGRGCIFAPEGGLLAESSGTEAVVDAVGLPDSLLRRRRGDLERRRVLEREVLVRAAENLARSSRHGGAESARTRKNDGERTGGAVRRRFRPDTSERRRRAPGAAILGGDDDESSR